MLGSIRYTFRLMRKHPFRSILTTIQIALGFWVIATIFNMNIQANNEIKDESATLNANLAQTYISDENFHPLTLTELDIFVENSSSIDTAFTYHYYGTVDIQHDDYTYNLYGLVETSATSPQLLGLELIDGNFFTPQDIRAQNRVVLISERMNSNALQGKKGIG
ncbi:MAG: ABC transporter permease [Firmicutes bacterium]|nr:ABC transporter permease [Bacillota bacterium]